jgi:hypothetical protein
MTSIAKSPVLRRTSIQRSREETRFNEKPAQNVQLVLRGKRQQSDVASLLDGAGEPALMRGAHSGQAPGHDLAALSNELLQQAHIAVGNRVDLLGAELADFFAPEELAAAAGTACGARPARAGTRA